MTDELSPRRSPERPAPRTGPALAVVVGLAIVVASVGLAARPKLHLPNHTHNDPYGGRDFALAIVTMVLGIVVLWIANHVKIAYQRLTYRLVGLIMLVVPGLVVNVNRLVDSARRAGPAPTPTPTPASATDATQGRGGNGGARAGNVPKLSLTEGWSIISLILTVAAVLLLGWLAFRILRRTGRHSGPVILPERTPDRDEVLRRATSALDLGTDPRGRVIAAYEAMEATLARQSAARSAEQAPLEWLAGLGDVQDAALRPARELTTIFERARFSSVPVVEADADRARRLLEQLRTTLAARASSPAGDVES